MYSAWLRRELYQNIFPSVKRKPLSVISPSDSSFGWHNTTGLSCHLGENILVYRLWSHVSKICIMTHDGETVGFRKRLRHYVLANILVGVGGGDHKQHGWGVFCIDLTVLTQKSRYILYNSKLLTINIVHGIQWSTLYLSAVAEFC
jgi:hypothetical protein